MTMAVSEGEADGAGSVICASTGTPPHPRRIRDPRGMNAFVLIPEGRSRWETLQAMIHGRSLQVLGNFDER